MEGCRKKSTRLKVEQRAKLLFMLFCLFSLCTSAQAALRVNAEWNSSARHLLMGNVGISTANDPASAMFYNPAALARNKKTTLELFNSQVEFGTGILSLSKSKFDLGKHANLPSAQKLEEAKPKTPSSLGASMYPNLWGPNFALGVLLKGEGASYMDDNSTLVYRSRYLVIPTMGLSIGLLGGRFKLGAAVRGIQITENDRSTNTNFAQTGYLQNPTQGMGLGLDIGTIFSLPWAALPAFGLVARNIGDTSFPGSAPISLGQGQIRTQEKIKMSYDAGASITPKLGQRSTLTLGADYRDVLNQTDTKVARRINLGAEVEMNKTVYLRAGVREGYWSLGMGFAGKTGALDFGTYAEELDRGGFRKIEDRRFVIRFGSRY